MRMGMTRMKNPVDSTENLCRTRDVCYRNNTSMKLGAVGIQRGWNSFMKELCRNAVKIVQMIKVRCKL